MSDEVTAFRQLAAAILAKSVDDLHVPSHAAKAAVFLLDHYEATVWAAWLPVPKRLVARHVAEAAARIATGNPLPHHGRPATRHQREVLVGIITRHGLAEIMAGSAIVAGWTATRRVQENGRLK